MLEEKDIERLIQAFEPVFATKEDLRSAVDDLSVKMDTLLNSVDAYAHKADAYFQEMVMLSHKVDRHERWILQLAEKLGVPEEALWQETPFSDATVAEWRAMAAEQQPASVTPVETPTLVPLTDVTAPTEDDDTTEMTTS